MKVAVIGRSELMYETALLLLEKGYEIGLIVTAKEAPEYQYTSSDFKALADRLNIPFYHTARIDELVDVISSIPDMPLALSVNYSGIIPESIIGLFPIGILNAHAGDLPRYRGNACLAWAILNGEQRAGLCIHKMIGGELDSGKIIARDYMDIGTDTKVTALWNWISQRIPSLFIEAVHALTADEKYFLEIQSTDPQDILRCYPLKPEDGKINWKDDASSIVRQVNAFNRPFNGAFFYLDAQKIIVWEATVAPFENFLAKPGQITQLNEAYVEVATGHNKVRLSHLEVNGELISPIKLCSSLRQRFI